MDNALKHGATSSRHASNARAPAHSTPQHLAHSTCSSSRALARLTARASASVAGKLGRRRSARPDKSSSSFSAPAPVGELPGGLPLDLHYMQEVYADAWQQQAGSHPEWVGRNMSILKRLSSLSSILQVQHLVESELASISGITVALVMLKAAVQLRPKNRQGRYYSMAQLTKQQQQQQRGMSVPEPEASADTSGAMHASSSSSSHSKDSNSTRAAEGSSRASMRVQQAQALHQQLTWLHRAPSLVRRLLLHMASLPANQVSLPSVAMALQSLSLVTEHRLPLTAYECSAVQALLGHVRADLFVATPEQLAQLAHGLCFARVTPPEGWLGDFSKAALSKMSLMSNYQLGFIAHALGRQSFVPDEFWLSMFASETAPKLAFMQPRQLSNMLWAVARWRVDPGDEWREAACSAVVSKLEELPPACLASVLRSLQSICPSLPLTWLAAVVARLVDLAPRASLRQDCEVLAAIASLTYMPDQGSMAAYVSAMQPKLAWATPSELAICLRSLARLHFLPTREWLHDWVAAAHRQVRGFHAEETANTLACFATWKIKPPRDFMQDLYELSASQARQDAFPPYFATRMLCALGTLRLAPPRQVLWALLHVLGSEALVARNEQVGVKYSSSMMAQSAHTASTHTTDSEGRTRAYDRARIAAALANAFEALPCLLRCYNIQQLAGLAGSSVTGGSVAVVGQTAWESHSGSGASDNSKNNSVLGGSVGMVGQTAWEGHSGSGGSDDNNNSSNSSISSSSSSSSNGDGSSSNGGSSNGSSSNGMSSDAWGGAGSNGTVNGMRGGAYVHPIALEGTVSNNGSGGGVSGVGGGNGRGEQLAAASESSSSNSSSSSSGMQQDATAHTQPGSPLGPTSDRLPEEAAALLLPPHVVGPMLAVLARRLGRLQPRHLCALACALVELQLYPGRGFLLAHVSAVAAHLPRMEASEKRCLHTCYTALNRR